MARVIYWDVDCGNFKYETLSGIKKGVSFLLARSFKVVIIGTSSSVNYKELDKIVDAVLEEDFNHKKLSTHIDGSFNPKLVQSLHRTLKYDFPHLIVLNTEKRKDSFSRWLDKDQEIYKNSLIFSNIREELSLNSAFLEAIGKTKFNRLTEAVLPQFVLYLSFIRNLKTKEIAKVLEYDNHRCILKHKKHGIKYTF